MYSPPILATEPAATGNSLTPRNEKLIVLSGILLTSVAFAYFQAASHGLFSLPRTTPIFRYLLTVEDPKTAWLTLSVCVLAALWRNTAPILKIVDFLSSYNYATVSISVILAALGAIFVYRNTAFSMDEYAAVFQAKIFAAGRLTAQLPPSVVDWLIPSGFNGAFLLASRTTGQAIEGYWPGFSLLLSPFEFFGVPWLCNACLAGLALFLVHRITLEIAGTRAAGWAVLFTLASGVFAAYAISYYSMQAHLSLNLLFVWLLLRPTPGRAFCAGAVGSLATVLHNPFPHLLFAIPWIYALARQEKSWKPFGSLVLGYLPATIAVGGGWLFLREYLTAGHSGLNLISDNLHAVFRFPDQSMIDMRLAAIAKMWMWAVPCLFLFAVVGRLQRRDDLRVRLLAQSAVLTFAGYVFFIFDQGHGWGYRYFHSAWGVVPILAGCAMTAPAKSGNRLIAFAGAAAILNILLVIPVQMTQIRAIIARHSAQLPEPRRPGNNVFFVSATGGFYLADLVQSDPLLRTRDLLLFSRGPELDAELRRQNWPTAELVERRSGVEEWNLGPRDETEFRFAYSDHAL